MPSVWTQATLTPSGDHAGPKNPSNSLLPLTCSSPVPSGRIVSIAKPSAQPCGGRTNAIRRPSGAQLGSDPYPARVISRPPPPAAGTSAIPPPPIVNAMRRPPGDHAGS